MQVYLRAFLRQVVTFPVPSTVTYVDIALRLSRTIGSSSSCRTSFVSDPSPPTIFNAAHSLWHLYDWVWHERNPGQDTRNNAAFLAYRDGLLTACPELGWLRDIADAGKHRGLGRPNVEVRHARLGRLGGWFGSSYFGSRWFGSPYFGGRQVYVVGLSDGRREEFATILRAAVEHWRTVEMAHKALPSPF